MNTRSELANETRGSQEMGNLDFFEVLRRRRSVRAYRSSPVEEDKLRRILSSANSAPSAGNLQAYEIVVIREDGMKQALARAAYGQLFIAQAPVVLMFCTHPRRSEVKYGQRGAELYALQDTTIACAYAELAAAALGLASVWIGALDASAAAEITGLSAPWTPLALLPIGYAQETPCATPRRQLDELVHEIASASFTHR
jgi:nitroreductase